MSDNNSKSMGDLFPDLGPEAPVISGVAHDRSEALATVRGVPNEPGMAANSRASMWPRRSRWASSTPGARRCLLLF